MGWDGASHILGRYIYRFTGSEYLRIPESSTLDVTQSFSLGFMLRPDPLSRLTYSLFCKGEPENPLTGSIFIESVEGYLKIFLHCELQTKSLVYITQNPVLNSSRVLYFEVVWDFTAKSLLVYLDGSPIQINIVTSSPSYITNPTLMGLITTNNDDLLFGKATGKNPYIGRVYDYIYIGRARTSVEIYNYYLNLEYTIPYPTQATVVFSSTRTGTAQLFTMYEDGTEQSQLINSGLNNLNPRWSELGNYVSYRGTNSSSGALVTNPTYASNNQNIFVPTFANKDGSGITSMSSSIASTGIVIPQAPYVSQIMEGTQNTIYLLYGGVPASNNFGIFKKTFSPLLLTEGTNFRNHGNFANITYVAPSYDNQYFFWTYHGINFFDTTGRGIYRRTVAGSGEITIVSNTSSRTYFNIRCNRQSTKIAYSAQDALGFYQIWISNFDGSSAIQLTFDNFNNFLAGFSADGTKLIFNAPKPVTGNYQIYLMNIDGSNKYNISNNSYNDYYGDSMVLP